MDPEPTEGRRHARFPKLKSRYWVLGATVVGGLVLTGCKLPTFGSFDSPTRQGQDTLKLWQGFFIAGLVVFVFMLILISFTVFRYRRRSDTIPRQTQYHTVLEIFYTVVPIITVLVLFVFTFITENSVNAFASNAMKIKVTAFQWGWEFQYPTYDVKVIGVETQNPTMVLPVGQPVRIILVSNDVIHGFYVPAFNFSRYAQPGVTNSFDFDVQRTGTFRGQCTQFCGLYHSLMIFQVKAVTQSQFQTWISQQQGTAAAAGSGTTHASLTAQGRSTP